MLRNSLLDNMCIIGGMDGRGKVVFHRIGDYVPRCFTLYHDCLIYNLTISLDASGLLLILDSITHMIGRDVVQSCDPHSVLLDSWRIANFGGCEWVSDNSLWKFSGTWSREQTTHIYSRLGADRSIAGKSQERLIWT